MAARRIPLVFEGGEIIEQRSTDTFEVGNGTFITPGTTADRTLAERAGDAVNVKDYGAKGDGEHDDTNAFQAAAAAANAKGAVVYVPHGTYKISEPVEGEFISFGHVTISGSGSVTRLTDLFNDYVHKRNYELSNEDIQGQKTFLGKVNFKADTVNEGNETHGKASGTTLTYHGTEVHDGNETHGKASGTTLTYHGTENHDGPETHSGTEAHSGNETHTGNVTFGTSGSGNKIVVNYSTEFKGPVDFSGMTDAQKADLLNDLIAGGTGDGFEVASGKLKVKTSELIPGTNTDGLEIDSNGKIKVKPSELAGTGLIGNDSTGKLLIDDAYIVKAINENAKTPNSPGASLMLASLGLPINLSSTVNWYVKSNGTNSPTYAQLIACSQAIYPNNASKQLTAADLPKGKTTSDIASMAYMVAYGWGRSESYAFKTIQACINFVCTYHTLPNSNCTIYPLAGTYTENLYVKNYNTAGGTLCISNPNYTGYHDTISSGNKVIIKGSGQQYTHTLSVTNVTVNTYGIEYQLDFYAGGSSTSTSSVLFATSNGEINTYNCHYIIFDRTATDMNNAAASTLNAVRHCYAYKNGTIQINGDSYFETVRSNARTGEYVSVPFHAEINSTVILQTTNNNITFKGDMNCLFMGERMSLVMNIGSEAPATLSLSNLKLGKVMSLATGSGFQLNNLCNTSTLHAISPHTGETAKADDTIQTTAGCWLRGYTAYSAS